MREERRHPADGADLAVDVVKREVAFRRGVEFEDARDGEALLERLPYVRPQPVAASEAQAMGRLARMRRRVDEIAGELADILHQRAVEPGHVVPELPRREFLADR